MVTAILCPARSPGQYRLSREKPQTSHFTSVININEISSFVPIRTASQDTNGKENGSRSSFHFSKCVSTTAIPVPSIPSKRRFKRKKKDREREKKYLQMAESPIHNINGEISFYLFSTFASRIQGCCSCRVCCLSGGVSALSPSLLCLPRRLLPSSHPLVGREEWFLCSCLLPAYCPIQPAFQVA